MNKELENLIQKDLTGNLNPEEKKKLEALLGGNEILRESYGKLWDKSRVAENISFNEDDAWLKLKQKIQSHQDKKRTIYKTVASIAAIFIIAVGITFWFVKRESAIVSYTSQSYMEVFYLPDGTQVWLNDNSTITLDAFSPSERRVTLVGEAYFKVKKDPTRPFTIRAGDSETKVLGTEFRLKAYPNQEKIEIKVESGRVQFSSLKTNSYKILYGNESGYLTISDNKLQKVQENYKEVAWLHSTTKPSKPVNKRTKEVYTHKDFLKNIFVIRENFVKQTVIEGEISNSATFTAYKNIRLKVVYITKGDEYITEYHDISEPIQPGKNSSYKLRIGNWFKQRKIETIEIVDAHAIQ